MAATGWTRCVQQAAALALAQIGGVQSKMWPLALQRSVEKGHHPFVDVLAQPGDGGFGDARKAHGLQQLLHSAGGDAADPGHLDHRDQGFFRRSSWARGRAESRCPGAACGRAAPASSPRCRAYGHESRCGRSAARQRVRGGRCRFVLPHRPPCAIAPPPRQRNAGNRRRQLDAAANTYTPPPEDAVTAGSRGLRRCGASGQDWPRPWPRPMAAGCATPPAPPRHAGGAC